MESEWAGKKYESLDQKLDAFLEYLNKDKDNTKKLVDDFCQFYFNEAPVISPIMLKRIFFGTVTETGLLALLKESI